MAEYSADRTNTSTWLSNICAFSILTHESTLIPGSTIGKHLRHSLDHYRLLLESIPRSKDAQVSKSASKAPLEVNYDTRSRLVDMERIPSVALDSFRQMDDRLHEDDIARIAMDKSVRLSALTPHHQEFQTSFGREVRY